MSAPILLDAIITQLRGLFPKVEVQEYAGQFNSEEIDNLSFNCPAILVSVLGWSDAKDSTRMGGARNARLNQCVAFVVSKRVDRDERMREAANMANALGYGLMAWSPADHELCAIGGVEDEPTAENLFGRAVDKKGLALWMVSWEQATKPTVPPAQLFELLAVEIESTAVHAVQGEEPSISTLAVSEEIQFKPVLE